MWVILDPDVCIFTNLKRYPVLFDPEKNAIQRTRKSLSNQRKTSLWLTLKSGYSCFNCFSLARASSLLGTDPWLNEGKEDTAGGS